MDSQDAETDLKFNIARRTMRNEAPKYFASVSCVRFFSKYKVIIVEVIST